MSDSPGVSNNRREAARRHISSSIRESQPSSKRRKIRKGTHSCWECKRRKERCIFLHEDNACTSCQKRGTSCVGQEFPDDTPSRTSGTQTSSDLARVESLLRQVLERLDGGQVDTLRSAREDSSGENLDECKQIALLETQTMQSDSGYYSPEVDSTGSHEASRSVECKTQCQHCNRPQSNDISQTLYAALPSQSDTEIICRATIRHQMGDIMVCAYDDYEIDGAELARELSNPPQPTAPPVLIARHLLLLAIHLVQRFRPGLHEEIEELSKPLPTLITSCANAAAQFVRQDRLLSGDESLECLILLGIYECSCGNTRLSWMLLRRAIAMAQMNGLHLHESQRFYRAGRLPSPRTLWIRLNYYDRLGSILLSLPMAAEDSSISVDVVVEHEPPLAKLERMHCAVLGEIVKRNQAEQPLRSLEVTKKLDRQLQKIADILPASYWMLPLLPLDRSSKTEFRNAMLRVNWQLMHFHIILQVHLPYLLQSSRDREYELSRIACVDAAREILTRFIMSRSVNHQDTICRICDFIAFTAAVTLVLAYLSRHHQCLATSAWPSHHRHGDLGMIQQVGESMQQWDPVAADPQQCAYMADLLHQLLRMEAKAAEGCKITIRHEKFTGAPSSQDQNETTVRLHVPYFGTIVIDPDASDGQPTNGCAPMPTASALNPQGPLGLTSAAAIPGEVQLLAPAENLVSFDAMPGMFAGPDNWTLQGIDTALFSSLFGQTGGDWVLNA